jgi:YggT family protein
VLLVILEVVYSVTDPPIKALRRVIPPLRIGNFALDLSFLIVLVGAYVLLRVNRMVFLS